MKKDHEISLGQMRDQIASMIENAKRNHQDPYDIPFVIEQDWHKYNPSSSFFGTEGHDFICGVKFYLSDEIKVVAPDSRPEVGEFWNSRGPSTWDCSGFVVSKPAGERLRRLVHYVLEKDETKSWLDYREYEPTWIQFKFSAEEFDVDMLDKLARENNNIITEDILRKCVQHKETK